MKISLLSQMTFLFKCCIAGNSLVCSLNELGYNPVCFKEGQILVKSQL